MVDLKWPWQSNPTNYARRTPEKKNSVSSVVFLKWILVQKSVFVWCQKRGLPAMQMQSTGNILYRAGRLDVWPSEKHKVTAYIGKSDEGLPFLQNKNEKNVRRNHLNQNFLPIQ